MKLNNTETTNLDANIKRPKFIRAGWNFDNEGFDFDLGIGYHWKFNHCCISLIIFYIEFQW
jgi:hypothetical protein